MCGVTGWVSFNRDLTQEAATIDAMTATMACRGPDAVGTWADRNAGLGHRRLAVIDLPGGVQPMSVSTPDGDVTLVYSGEAYNFTELRDELTSKGMRFATASDTEVVLRGYLHWGEAVAERLNGMFAFAIWDARVRKLVMIRDRMGIKPLYFYATPDGVIFGSEPKAILANPIGAPVVDLDGLRELVSHIKTPKHAVWQGMSEVEPGTMVIVDENGVRERTYWRLEARLHTDGQEATVARVRELLDDIIRRQLVADVPECVLLSGGLDSSTVTALSARQLDVPVRTFSVDFVDNAKNFQPNDFHLALDGPYIRDVVGHVGSDHTDVVLDHETLADPDIRRTVVRAWDFPTASGDMNTSMYLMFKMIREQSTVALSGESSDELFGGYSQFHDPEMQRADAFPWLGVGRFGAEAWMLTPALHEALDLETYRRDRYAQAVAEVERIEQEDEFTHRMRVMSYLHLTRYVRNLLDRKDRLSMAVGLEVRVPFCDHRLIEYVYNTPWALKSFDGREKSLLRAAARDVLPESVLSRKKVPYPSTQDPRYIAAIQQQAKDLLASTDDALFAVVDRNQLEQATSEDPSLVTPAAKHRIEAVLEMAIWLDSYRPTLAI